MGALGAALCAMVARITAGADRLVSVLPEALAIVAEADELRRRFAAARPLDEAAYERVVAASALPKGTDPQNRARTAALQAALVGAAEAPLAAAALSADGIALADRTYALGNTHLDSDVECALHFFRAALAASAANVRINHRFIKDTAVVHAQEERLTGIVDAAAATLRRRLPNLP